MVFQKENSTLSLTDQNKVVQYDLAILLMISQMLLTSC